MPEGGICKGIQQDGKMMRKRVKALWSLCFNDSPEFVDMYFKLRYNNDINLTLQSGGKVIAALQMLPYPMSLGDTEINTAYISGACTHPDYRNRGVMHELLSQAFIRMLHRDVVLSTLIPGEPGLFSYYARKGYAPVFNCAKTIFRASGVPGHRGNPVLKVNLLYKPALYEYLNRKLAARPCYVRHTEQDFRVILSEMRLSGGAVFSLIQKDQVVALAVGYHIGTNRWQVGEIAADTPELNAILLRCICDRLEIPSLEVLAPPAGDENSSPIGMARIINAKAILQLHAAAHPETDLNIHLLDDQISANNGYYYLNNGKCMNSAKRLPGKHLLLTVSELTEKILTPLNPYMSLMLN